MVVSNTYKVAVEQFVKAFSHYTDTERHTNLILAHTRIVYIYAQCFSFHVWFQCHFSQDIIKLCYIEWNAFNHITWLYKTKVYSQTLYISAPQQCYKRGGELFIFQTSSLLRLNQMNCNIQTFLLRWIHWFCDLNWIIFLFHA